jgi:predicted AAA+ superfamily ATPase
MEPSILTLKADRRTGKTTLAEYYLKKSKEEGLRVGYITFSSVMAKDFEKRTGIKSYLSPTYLVGINIDVLVIDEYEELKRRNAGEGDYWLNKVFKPAVHKAILIIN